LCCERHQRQSRRDGRHCPLTGQKGEGHAVPTQKHPLTRITGPEIYACKNTRECRGGMVATSELEGAISLRGRGEKSHCSGSIVQRIIFDNSKYQKNVLK
jgi:hypothetical protein